VQVLILGTPDGDGPVSALAAGRRFGLHPRRHSSGHHRGGRTGGRSLWTADQVARAQRWWEEVGCKLEALTKRERQVLALVAEGLSNRQIAGRLSLSVNTVQTHMRHIFVKLAVNNRVETAALFLRKANINQTWQKSPILVMTSYP